MVQFIWNDQRGDTGQTMRGRSGKALVAPVTGGRDGVRRKAVGKVFCFGVGCEKMKFSDFETTVEFFGLNWQLIELAS